MTKKDASTNGIYRTSRFGRRVVAPIIELAILFNRAVLKLDWSLHRSYGGILHKWLRVDGYSHLSFSLLFSVLLFVFGTPSLLAYQDSMLAFWGFIASFIGAVLLICFVTEGRLVFFQALYLFFVSTLLFLLSYSFDAPIKSPFFPHSFLIFVVILALLTISIAIPLAWILFRSLSCTLLADALDKADLFTSAVKAAELNLRKYSSFWSVLRAFFVTPLERPISLLFLPAVCALLPVSARDAMFWSGVGMACSLVMLALSNLHAGLGSFLAIVLRALFRGAQNVVSIAIILIGSARLAGIDYVSTVLESSPGATIGLYIIALYTLLWLYEYWTNRLVTERVMMLLHCPTDGIFGRRSYRLNPTVFGQVASKKPKERVLQIHGASRFAICNTKNSKIEILGRTELLDRLADNARVSSKEVSRLRSIAREVEKRIRFYFATLGSALIVALILVFQTFNRLPEQPAVIASSINLGKAEDGKQYSSVSLRDLIFEKKVGNKNRIILVCASGGGTRAAMYAQSFLEGLWRAGELQNVVLVSGVSGGAVALSFFGQYREELLKADSVALWDKYRGLMAAPYIADVLERLWQWRLLEGVRMGKLLEESFNTRFPNDLNGKPLGINESIGELRDMAVIFNTAIAGHEDKKSMVSSTRLAGGILAFTNLKDSGFPTVGLQEMPSEFLRYVEVRDGRVRFTAASALSANFPPVFPNAAVDVGRARRYWVTDGGAVENRGVLSLLYSLREALMEEFSLRDGQGLFGDERPATAWLPEIDVVILEASAENDAFYQDRGVGSVTSASRKLISQMVVDMWRETSEWYTTMGGKPENIRLHNLAMPLVLRSNGGIGTHWMLPRKVTLVNNAVVNNSAVKSTEATDSGSAKVAKKVVLNRRDTKELIRMLHTVPEEEALFQQTASPRLLRAWAWIKADAHRETWLRFLDRGK